MKVRSFVKKSIIFLVALLFLPTVFGGGTAARADDDQVDKLFNLVVRVNFDGDGDFSDEFSLRLENTFSSDSLSVAEYIRLASNGNARIESTFFDETVTLDESVEYYMPRYEYSNVFDMYMEVNPNGYESRYFDVDGNPVAPGESGAKQHIDRFLREQSLIKEAAKAAAKAGVEMKDGDVDSRLDNLTVIVMTADKSLGWNEILWSHTDYTYTYHLETLAARYYLPEDFDSTVDKTLFTATSIDGLRVRQYTLLPSSSLAESVLVDEKGNEHLNVGLACHEIMHAFGAADYYPYDTLSSPQSDPMGDLEIMSSPTYIPQMPTTYVRLGLGWLDQDENVAPIERDGTYTLFPTTSDSATKAYKLVLNDYSSTGEYFMIEARSDAGRFDSSLPGSGIIVYRVNEKNGYLGKDGNISTTAFGNTYGDNEVFIFRLGNEELFTSKYGGVSYALLDGAKKVQKGDYYVDRSTIGSLDKSANKWFIDPNDDKYLLSSIYYSDGTNSGIMLKNITVNADGSVTFDVDFDDGVQSVGDLAPVAEKYYDGQRKVVRWQSGLRVGTVRIVGLKGADVLRYRDGNYLPKGSVTAKKILDGKFEESTVFTVTAPASYCMAYIPEPSEMTGVFIIYEDENGNVTGKYCYTAAPSSPTFGQYLLGTTVWRVTIILVICVFVVVFAVGTVIIYKKSRKEEALASEGEIDLTDQFGENYWLEGDEENAESAEDNGQEAEKDQSDDTAQDSGQ